MAIYTQKKAPGTPTWVDLGTSDPEAARAFYSKIFGWTYAISGPEFGYYANALIGENMVAGVGPLMSDATPSIWSVYLATDDPEADSAKVIALGGQVIVPTMHIGDLGSMTVCVDPTGAFFGMWQSGVHIGGTVANEPGTMTWFEVSTREAAKARDFYCGLHGQTAQAMPGSPVEYYMLSIGDNMASGIMQMDDVNWAGIPPHWMAYFAVADTDATIKIAVEAGGKLMVPAFDMPYGRMAVIADPQGAVFSIVKLAPGRGG